MTRCLVIGGNGFIGSHVVDELASMGHEVTVFDRLSDNRPRFKAAGVTTRVGDFLNVGELADALRGQDVVFHLLSTSTPASAEADPLLDVRTNVTGSIELFRLAAGSGVQHVYFASTGGAIYGEHGSDLVDEDTRPEPVSPYAIGKLTIERYLQYFRRTRGLQSTSLRLSNPYGPRQSPLRKQGVIPIFLRQLWLGEPLTVYGDGSMVRDYIYVADIARMIVAPLGSTPTDAVYNVGSGVGHSINEILDSIARVTGLTPDVRYAAVPPTFVQRIALDVAKFTAEFGSLTHPIDLDAGVRLTWEEMTSS